MSAGLVDDVMQEDKYMCPYIIKVYGMIKIYYIRKLF